MRNLKKFLALVMAMVMAFSLMLSASATTTGTQFDDAKDVTPAFEEAVDVLVGMKVFQGDEGGFRPASNITRAEVAVLIYRLATGDTGTEKVELYNTQHPFTDVKADDWFAGYVGYCWNAGYIKGTTKTTFNPYGQVTGYEVLAMILRAVGYDKNDEFTGGDWIVNVSSTAQQRGILKDVKSTHYGNTLHLPSRRDVVASLLFNAAIIPQVVYTPAFGYQTTGMNNNTLVNPIVIGSRQNDTLGYQNFGLEVNHGIIVGNQETGKTSTIIGVTKKDGSHDYNGNDAKPSYADVLNADNTVKTALTTVSLKLETGLKEYGHEFRVWFNADDSGAKTVYAYYDKVNKTKLVVAHDNEDVLTTARNESKLGNIAAAAGFTSISEAFVSPAFDGFYGPKTSDMGIFESDQNLYVLIANGTSADLDAIIALNVNSTKINWVDNNAIQKTVTIDTIAQNQADKYVGTAGANPATSKGDNTYNANLKSGTISNDIVIYQDNLTANSTKTLNDYVVANAIGMMNVAVFKDMPGYTIKGYNLQKPTTKTGHVISYKTDAPGNADPNGQTTSGTVAYQRSINPDYVVLDDGTQIKKSPLYYTVDGYHTANPEIPQVWVDMNNDNTLDTEAYTARSYRFYLDSNGDYIGAEPIFGETFIYGTYADYSQATSTSTFKYYLTGVNMNGEVVTEEFTHFNNNAMITQNLGTLDVYYHNFNQVGDSQNITGIGGTQYKGFVLNNRNLTDGNYSAAQLATTMSPADIGVTTSILNGANDPGTENVVITDWATETSTNATSVAGKTVINKRDALVGAVEAFRYSGQGYFLTNNTKFIVVSGYGTDTVKPAVYNGIGDLLGSGREVRIDAANFASQFAFTTSDYYYANDGVYSKQIDTIFLPARAVTGIDDGSAFFLASEAPVMYNAIGSNVAKYTMYLDGERQDTWINNFYESDGTTVEPASTVNNYNRYKFFELRATSSTAHDGETIYNAYAIAENRLASYGIINPCQDDNAVAKSIPYSAATRDATVATINGVLYNVSNAKVVNLIPANTPNGYDLTYVNSVPELNDLSTIAGQIHVSGDVARVYAIQTEKDSAVVSAIYVVDVDTNTLVSSHP